MKPLSQVVVLSMLMGAGCQVPESESEVSSRPELVALAASELTGARIELDGQEISVDPAAHYYVARASEPVAATERQALQSLTPGCAKVETYRVNDPHQSYICSIVTGTCSPITIIYRARAECAQTCANPNAWDTCQLFGAFPRLESRTWVIDHQSGPVQVTSFACNSQNTCQ